ncbi:MAG: recombinase family protein, partial [Candidatus Saccharimonadales bacterium]
RMKREKGYCEGRKAYGSRDGESMVITGMQALRDAGFTFDAIAQQLNDAGQAPRSGKAWYGATVANILRRKGVA